MHYLIVKYIPIMFECDNYEITCTFTHSDILSYPAFRAHKHVYERFRAPEHVLVDSILLVSVI